MALTLVLLGVGKCLQCQGTHRWRDGHVVGEGATRGEAHQAILEVVVGKEGRNQAVPHRSLSRLPALPSPLWHRGRAWQVSGTIAARRKAFIPQRDDKASEAFVGRGLLTPPSYFIDAWGWAGSATMCV